MRLPQDQRKHTDRFIEKKLLESIILNPKYAPFLAVLKAARNGAVYGAKVRFPHALV
jgi:peroxisomal membrane protein 4